MKTVFQRICCRGRCDARDVLLFFRIFIVCYFGYIVRYPGHFVAPSARLSRLGLSNAYLSTLPPLHPLGWQCFKLYVYRFLILPGHSGQLLYTRRRLFVNGCMPGTHI